MTRLALSAGETSVEIAATELVAGDIILIGGARVTIGEVRRWIPRTILIITTAGVRLMRPADQRLTRIVPAPAADRAPP